MKYLKALLLIALLSCPRVAAEKHAPNIVIILVDDMGYGDPGCYNPQSKIPTPHIDSLAREGMRFTDVHSPGPLCHPSRYGLMTGRFAFRTDVSVWPKQPLINDGQVTIASFLKSQGYRTAIVGKWHLGFRENGYDKPLPGGPLDCGFDSYFGMRASTDIPPYFYIRGDRAVRPPTDFIQEEFSGNWSRIQGRRRLEDGIAPGMKLEEVLPRFTSEAVKVVARLKAEMKRIVDAGRSRPVTKNEVLRPYDGPSVSGIDTTTLTGKVMCGYQGWFNCEGDGADIGWTHWARNRRRLFSPGNITVDLWPDMSELGVDERFVTGFHHADGHPAEVFSSFNRQTVLRHFAWMRDYGIDGAFVQRFVHGLKNETMRRHKDTVLAHAREGANRAGRAYAVMYDLSGLPSGGVSWARDDWRMLRGKMRITEDSAYLHHDGRPVVAVWGVGFNDKIKPRKYSLAECKELVIYLKEDGCTVMLGVPTGWRRLDRDALPDPEFHDILQLADIVSPWTVGRYRDLTGVALHADRYWKPDITWCADHDLDYLPVVFPGFSWHHQKGGELGAIPRLKGQFFWSQIAAVKQAGCKMIYVAMFDEVDEGTAIFKCTNEPPTGDGVPFLTYEGLPSDYYLRLTGQAGKLIRGELPSTDTMPVVTDPR